jgi:hypothetical protein
MVPDCSRRKSKRVIHRNEDGAISTARYQMGMGMSDVPSIQIEVWVLQITPGILGGAVCCKDKDAETPETATNDKV